MSRTEFIWVSADLEEVVDTIRNFPESNSEQEVTEGEFRFSFERMDEKVGNLTVGVEVDLSEDYPTVIDVEQARWIDAPEKVQFFFDLLAERTTWEIASRFDDDDRPQVHRPLSR
ncbi:hypothetical protein ACOQFV_17640 [Nocardiopsis changdeensis]|uniref:Uncharacterized protein n=1 Tax=Nocardiopsis changdeensis TaxID=2831969 RepID=A0ABX8BP20_9ACTN|nr:MULTISPECIES: hypothetical protein [Nocardiopsis]QUX23990.1 hypothetical protein KGD84_06590 [Nocardiopsis changdeensis]QYX39935.1 hypothetical protein K1J57_16045 [Nocardiopsis sp. MT53]